jgi:polyhydroxyalkanoate synthesis repressor PhaR
MTAEPRLIKKHANRRLYDTEEKKYVSLLAIRDLILTGTDIRVEDSSSGEDITRPVLLQIMAECEQDDRPMLSPSLLMSLIRQYGNPMQEYVGPFLEKSLSFYARQESRMRQRISTLATLEGHDTLAAMRDSLMQILTSGKSDKTD